MNNTIGDRAGRGAALGLAAGGLGGATAILAVNHNTRTMWAAAGRGAGVGLLVGAAAGTTSELLFPQRRGANQSDTSWALQRAGRGALVAGIPAFAATTALSYLLRNMENTGPFTWGAALKGAGIVGLGAAVGGAIAGAALSKLD